MRPPQRRWGPDSASDTSREIARSEKCCSRKLARCSLSRPSTRTGFASDGDRVLDERFTHLDLSLEQPAQFTHSLCRQLTWRSSSHQDSRDRPRGIKDRWDKKAEYRPCVMWSRSTEHQQQLPLALPPGRRRRRPALPTKGENRLLHPLQEGCFACAPEPRTGSDGADPLYVHQGVGQAASEQVPRPQLDLPPRR